MLPKLKLEDELEILKEDFSSLLETVKKLYASSTRGKKEKVALCFFSSLNQINRTVVELVDQEMTKKD